MSSSSATKNNNLKPRLSKQYITIPFHTILVAVNVWLSLYATNYNELPFDNVLASGLVTITVAIVLVLLLFGVLRNIQAASVISTLIIVCLAYYGHTYDVLDNTFDGALRNKIFMPGWVVIFLILMTLTFIYRSRLENLTKILNASSLVLILIPFGSIIFFTLTESQSTSSDEASQLIDMGSLSADVSSKSDYPNIYFLIFDRYADNRTLKSNYNYDNSDLLEHLRGLGFYIADKSRANYTKTGHSLASSLNMKHLTYLSESMGPDSSDWKPLYAMLRDNVVARFLKANGYFYVHLGSSWEPTRHSPLADENYEVLSWGNISLNEFEILLIEPMLPTRIASNPFGSQSGSRFDARLHKHKRVQQKFKKLSTLRRNDAPMFVFSHMLVPHPAFVFYPDGRYKTDAEAATLNRERNYIDQLIYTNNQIKVFIDQLI